MLVQSVRGGEQFGPSRATESAKDLLTIQIHTHGPQPICWEPEVNNLNDPLSHEKKNSYFPLYWLVSRDHDNGLLQSPHNWVV